MRLTFLRRITLGIVLIGLPLTAWSKVECANVNLAVPVTTPTVDFVLHADGTATHTPTDLMWMRCSLGQDWNGTTCTGSAALYTNTNWRAALQAAQETQFAGYADWRLPNSNELGSIVEERCWDPSINAAVFPNTPSRHFRSSSPYARNPVVSWVVGFGGSIDGNYAVRLVRAGHHHLGAQIHYTWEKTGYPSIASGSLDRVSSTVNHLPAGYVGVWRGRGVQTNPSSEWSILIGLGGSRVGAVVGTIAYPSLACGGELTLLEVTPESLMLHETITYGRCVDGGTIILSITDDQMAYNWEKAGYPSIASGSLDRVSSTVNHLPAGYVGVWRGRGVSINPSTEWSILIGLGGSQVGAVVGAIAYPSLACGGELTLLEVTSESLVLHETITYGRCVDDGIVTLSLVGPGSSGAGGH